MFRLVGVLHLPPLPGAPNYLGHSISAIADAAAEDAQVLVGAGFTDVMIQDASDNPQPTLIGPATVAAMSVIGAAVRRATDVSLGVVAGHNDGPSAVAIAHAIDAQFIRVKVLTGISVGPTGWIEGCSSEVAHMKRLLGSGVEVWADAHEATSRAVTGDVRWAAAEALSFGGADKIIVTRDSGVNDAISDIAAVKALLDDNVDVLIGGRVTATTLGDAVRGSDGAILGSAIKDGPDHDARISPAAVERLADAFRTARDAAAGATRG
ncbi:BtpA/SgcQ family protein [Subtercola boreus]|uniref:BtpA/SgcQ family protein n=1 Tax=Subtercola boreus TaxID=120213 RepID=UPI0015593026|nr:BtpA/SgcQ family protein [Subtercola boreus]